MKEEQIRPKEIMNRYLELSTQDAKRYFEPGAWAELPCPACDSKAITFSFKKNEFSYQECTQCRSLYLSPRPPLENFVKFYNDSESSNYWANTFFPTVAEARRELIFAKRAEQIFELCKEHKINARDVVDVGAGYGIFSEEWKKKSPDSKLFAIEPGCELARVCRSKGIEVLETVSENAGVWREKFDLATCFEVIEHAHNPLSFVKSIFDLVKPGGCAVVSGLGGDGFDIQILWEKSKSVSPPHHINFLSIEGFETLFLRAGFDQVKVLTPGRLDVDIVKTNWASLEAELPRFLKTMFRRSPQTLDAFQTFLSENNLSSHTWIVGFKK